MKFFWALIIAIALFIFCTPASAKEPVINKDSDCSYGMRLKDRKITMRLQCGKDKPVDMDRCDVKAMQIGKKDKVFLFITCCSIDDYCMTVVVPTDKTIL